MPTIVETHIHHGIVRTIYDDDTYRDHLDHPDGDFYPILKIKTPHPIIDSFLGNSDVFIEIEYNGELSDLDYTIDGGSATNHSGGTSVWLDNLSAGSHTIVFTDPNYSGYSWSHTFIIKAAKTYSVRWKLEFTDLSGQPVFVQIQEAGYSGSEIEVCGTGNPLKIEWDDDDDAFIKPIRGSRAIVSLIAETDEQFMEILEGDDGDFILTVLRGSPATTIFSGVIQSEGVTIPYKAPGSSQQVFSLVAVDQLAFLKDKKLEDRTGNPYNHDRISVAEFIIRELYEIDDMVWEQAPKLYINDTIRPFGSSASTTPLRNQYLDLNSFFDAKGESPSLYEVFERILAPKGLQIMKIGKDFYIRTIQKQLTYTQFYYYSNFVTLNVSGVRTPPIGQQVDLVKSLTGKGNGGDFIHVENRGLYRFKRPIGRAEVRFKYDKHPDFIINPKEDRAWDENSNIIDWYGNATIEQHPYYNQPLDLAPVQQGNYPLITDINEDSLYALATTDPHIKSKVIKVKKSEIDGKKVLFKIEWAVQRTADTNPIYRMFYEVIVGPLSMNKNGTWTGHSIHNTTGTDIEEIAMYQNFTGDSLAGERLSEAIDFSLANLDGTYDHVDEVDVMVRVWGLYTTPAAAADFGGVYLKELSLQFIDGTDDSSEDYVAVNTNTGKRGTEELELKFGSTNELVALPTCVWNQFIDADGFPIQSWVKNIEGTDISTGLLLENLADRIAFQKDVARRVYEGSMKGNVFPHHQITLDGEQYAIQSLSIDVKRNIASVKMIELSDTLV